MTSIIKLRLLKFKDELKLIILMSAIAIMMVGGFSKAYSSAGLSSFAIVDLDNSRISAELLVELQTLESFEFKVMNEDDAIESVKDENVVASIIIPEDYFERMNSENPLSIRVVQVKDSLETMTVKNIIYASLNKLNTGLGTANRSAKILAPYTNYSKETIEKGIYDNIRSGWQDPLPLSTSIVLAQGQKRQYDSLVHSIIGFTLFFSTYAMVFGISEILNEKENHTWQRQLVSPISKSSMVIGNLLMTMLSGSFNILLLFLGGKYLFGMDWAGSMVDIFVLVIAFVFAMTSMGLMMSGFIKTYGQLSATTPIVLTGLAMLGGCFWPIEIVSSKIMVFIAKLTPHYWAVNGLEKVAMLGYTVSDVMNNVIFLTVMGLVYTFLGVLTFKNE